MLDSRDRAGHGAAAELARPRALAAVADEPLPTLYDEAILKSIFWVVSKNEDTRYIAYHSPACAAPEMPARPNLEVLPHPLVPAGRILVEVAGEVRRDEPRLVRSIRFGEHSTEIEFVDRDLPAADGVRPVTAITVPYDEVHADDLDQLRFHAGILVGQALSAWSQS